MVAAEAERRADGVTRERGTASMGTDSSSPVLGGAARTVARHHPAVVGFLLGLSLVLLVRAAVPSRFGPRARLLVCYSVLLPVSTAIGLLQSAPAVRADQNAGSAPPTSPSSTSSNSTEGNYMKQDNVQKAGKVNKVDEEHLDHEVQKNHTEAKIDDEQRKTAEEAARQRVKDASDKMEEELVRQEIDQTANKDDSRTELGGRRKPICDLSDPRYDICEISGDARAIGANRTVLYVPPAGDLVSGNSQEWSIRDQSRKHLEFVQNVTVRSMNASQAAAAPACTSRHAVPAVVFAMNGLTSNPWHDFSDVLVPLFITTRAYEGEVQFLVSDLQPWFVDKYRLILKNLSRYDVVDFNRDAGVRCYPHVTVGLRSHRDLGIDPARAPRNYSMLDFRLYVREVYSLPSAGVGIPYRESANKAGRKPRLMLINRGRTRKFVNFPEIVAAVRAAGFEVVPIEPRRDVGVEALSRLVDSCDMLMGAHGAGLTNFVFLRTDAVMLQVVPWGHMEHSAMRFYGGPAREMRLRDVEYSVAAEESTLYDKYGKDHPAVSDPESIHRQGWQLGMRYYWIEQDIRFNVSRFAPTLKQVLRMITEM